MKNMKIKNIIPIIILALILIVGIILILFQDNKKEQEKNPDSENFADVPYDNRDILQEEYLEDGKIYINDIKYSYNGEKFILSLVIENKSNKAIDLRGYTIKVLNNRKIVLSQIGGNALGVIKANDKMASIIELTDNISTVYELQFVK